MQLYRFGASMEQELVDLQDTLARQRCYAKRSKALRTVVSPGIALLDHAVYGAYAPGRERSLRASGSRRRERGG